MAKTPADDEAWKVADQHRLSVPQTDEQSSESPSASDREAPANPGRVRAIEVAIVGGALAIVAGVLVWYPRDEVAPPIEVETEPESASIETAGGEVASAPGTRAEAVRARRALASMLRDRALGRGDSPELDDALDRLRAAFGSQHWSQACAQADAATAIASELIISGRMVRARLARAERRAERAEDSMVRERLEVGIIEGRALLDEGEIEAANRRLIDAMTGTGVREVGGGALESTPAVESPALP